MYTYENILSFCVDIFKEREHYFNILKDSIAQITNYQFKEDDKNIELQNLCFGEQVFYKTSVLEGVINQIQEDLNMDLFYDVFKDKIETLSNYDFSSFGYDEFTITKISNNINKYQNKNKYIKFTPNFNDFSYNDIYIEEDEVELKSIKNELKTILENLDDDNIYNYIDTITNDNINFNIYKQKVEELFSYLDKLKEIILKLKQWYQDKYNKIKSELDNFYTMLYENQELLTE